MMNHETMEYINILLCKDIAEKRRMMMDAINNGFDDDTVKHRIEDYRSAYVADKDFDEWWEDQKMEADVDG